MPSFISPPESAQQSSRIGVLLVNLGTPDGTDYWPMRRYLKEFLSDPRVVETPRAIWWFILNFFILTFRPRASGRKYKEIWNQEMNESPLRTITRAQIERLNALPHEQNVVYEWAMRYGQPSIANGLSKLQAQGCDRILIVPLYPQYCAATSASVCDAVFDHLKKLRWQPSIRIAPPWYEMPSYIEALVHSAQTTISSMATPPEMLLLSYHGIPAAFEAKGDPYTKQCARTTELFASRWHHAFGKPMMTFQSRFGPAAWVEPYTDETLKKLASEGIKHVAVMTPGFVADCLETLEEIAQENKEIFVQAGGESYTYIPCLNDTDEGIRVLKHIIDTELSGWV